MFPQTELDHRKIVLDLRLLLRHIVILIDCMKGDFIKKFNTVNKGNFNSNFYEIFGTLPGERLIMGDRLI